MFFKGYKLENVLQFAALEELTDSSMLVEE